MKRSLLFAIGAALLLLAASALPAAAQDIEQGITPFVGATFGGQAVVGAAYQVSLPMYTVRNLTISAQAGVVAVGDLSQASISGLSVGPTAGFKLTQESIRLSAGVAWTPNNQGLWWVGFNFPFGP